MTQVLNTQTGATTSKESLDESVDLLRAMVALTTDARDDQLYQTLKMTVQGYDPHTIQQHLGITRAELADTVKLFGQRFGSRFDDVPDSNGTVLFPLEPKLEVIEKLPKHKREEALEEASRIRAENPLPQGWELEFHEVGVQKAVAAIRKKIGVNDNLRSLALRVHASKEHPSSGLLTFPAMRAVWLAVQLGQFHRLARDPELPLRTAETVLVSYDALETAREDSVAAMRELWSDPDVENLEALAVRARPMAEASVRRLERVLANTQDSPNLVQFRRRGMNVFLRETANLRLPDHVGELNEGQVHRIGLMLGLLTDPISDKDLVAAESRLKDLGLEDDVPWLKGLWISAVSCKRESDFWDAVDRLISGEIDWSEPLK